MLWIVSLFVVLFTERNPFLGFQTMYLRYYWRVSSFAGFMRNEYPPFDFATDDTGVVSDSAVVTVLSAAGNDLAYSLALLRVRVAIREGFAAQSQR